MAPNPVLFRNVERKRDYVIAFTTLVEHTSIENTEQIVYSRPAIFFYNIERKRETIMVPRAMAILKFDPAQSLLMYLTNINWNDPKNDSLMPNCVQTVKLEKKYLQRQLKE